ncbi:MAG: hypothetical protein GOMPHAMPRED_000661 [Gomphillus americanus]|uniref:Uncharacterized protein n=1 Tax=Gomphillus americanus TaxID=1940652 RepID=A0A8H3F6J7_9LECA|nr:MAG: hypothetical protein GOMPHAMPRED_000661 [Gomphillus americanus]
MLQASDARRVFMQRLDDAIGNPFRMMGDPKACLQDCFALLRTLEEEYNSYAGPLLARLYYDAFQICIAHGDQARARVFADRAYKARVICEGIDSPEILKMERLSKTPAMHPSFEMYSTNWELEKSLVPKSLDGPAFETWLFRDSEFAKNSEP